MTVPFGLAWYLYYAERARIQYYNKGNWVLLIGFFAFYVVFGNVYEAFNISMNPISDMVFSQALSAALSNGVMYIVIWLLSKHFGNPGPMLLAYLAEILIAYLWARLAKSWYYRTFPPLVCAAVYEGSEGMERLVPEYGLDKKYDVKYTFSVKECLEDLSRLDACRVVFMFGVHSHERNVILKYCIQHEIKSFVVPRIGDILMSGAERMHMFHRPILEVMSYHPSVGYVVFKRCADIVISGIAAIVLSPVMLVTALAIKFEDHGPVFYKQKRLTKGGKVFSVLKFRSMRVDAEKDGVARLSSGENDTRITRVGKFIRSCRIDELPQLFNIIRGDMSIVGPRPERPEIAEQYYKELPEFALRLQAKAGLTGFAQVYGKYNTTPYDKLQMDLMYIVNPSIREDVKICFATVKILFQRESTEGIAAGQTTAMKEESRDE